MIKNLALLCLSILVFETHGQDLQPSPLSLEDERVGLFYTLAFNQEQYNIFSSKVQGHWSRVDGRFELGSYDHIGDVVNAFEWLYANHQMTPEIVSYFNKTKLTIDEALVFVDNQNKHDVDYAMDGNILTVEDLNQLLYKNDGEIQLDYYVQVGLYDQKLQFPPLPNDKSIQVSNPQAGTFSYRIGSFKTRHEAEEFMAWLETKDINKSYITSFYGKHRVSTMLAEAIENLYVGSAAH